MMMRRLIARALLLALVIPAGCLQIAGYEDAHPGWTGSGGSAAAGGAGNTTSTGSTASGSGGSSCADGIRNGSETGVDCGGGTCLACPHGEGCKYGSDCQSLVCTVGNTCAAPACNDGIKNGDEVDKDCGGICAGCAIGAACAHSSDCAGGATCKANECADPFVWAKRYGDTGDQVGNGIATSRSGSDSIAVIGSFAGAIDFGGGSKTSAGGDDAFLAYLDGNGNEFWSLRFGDASPQHATSIAIGKGNNMRFAGDFVGAINVGKSYTNSGGAPAVFVASFDASKSAHGSTSFGSGTNPGVAIAADNMDNVLVTGGFTGAKDFGGGTLTSEGGEDIFIVKLDNGSNHVWSKRFGDANGQRGTVIATDAMGNVVVAGSLGGGAISFGGASVTGDIFVAKFDPNGNHLWSKGYAGFASKAAGIATDSSGAVVVAGSFLGSIDLGGGSLAGSTDGSAFVLKLDAAGNHVWSKSFAYTEAPSGAASSGLAVDASGDVLVVGDFSGTVDFGGGPLMTTMLPSSGKTDIFVVKLAPNGNHVWSGDYGNGDYAHAAAVAVDGSGNAIVTGYFQGSIDFGGGPLTSAGGKDLFVAKLAP